MGFLGRHILFYHPQAAALKQRAAALMVGYLRLRASVDRLLINFKHSIDFPFSQNPAERAPVPHNPYSVALQATG